MQKIYIATSSFAEFSVRPFHILRENKYDVVLNEKGRKLTIDDMKQLDGSIVGVIAGTEEYSDIVLDNFPSLKVISRLGVGTDNISISAINKRGIKLYTTKTSPAPAVAELALGGILCLLRNIISSDNDLRKNVWKKRMGSLFQEKTLGVIGLGEIGKTLVKKIQGFGLRVIAFDKFHDDTFSKKYNVEYYSLDYVMENSDIISVHLNLTNETKNIISGDLLGLMKSGAIFVNTSRGEVVDELELYKILKEERILGAVIDVFNKEPYSGPLIKLNNTVLTPHISSYAKEVRVKMELEACENIVKGLNE